MENSSELLVAQLKNRIDGLERNIKSLCDIINIQRFSARLGMDMRREVELELYEQKAKLNEVLNGQVSQQRSIPKSFD